ncbi:MAG: head-tail connector protein [Pseudomonadota bacterium]
MFTLITPPAVEPISLSDLKSALRVDHSDDDTIIIQIAETARAFIERRLDMAFLRQTWSFTLDHIPHGGVTLRPRRLIDVTSVSVKYGDGVANTLADSKWCLFRRDPAHITVDAPQSEGEEPLTELQILFNAGFPSVADIPAELLRALYMLTAHYYEEREAFRNQRYVPVPYGVEAILATFKEVRL